MSKAIFLQDMAGQGAKFKVNKIHPVKEEEGRVWALLNDGKILDFERIRGFYG